METVRPSSCHAPVRPSSSLYHLPTPTAPGTAAWNGELHFNLNKVAFVSNVTENPEMCLPGSKPEVCLSGYSNDDMHRGPDGSLIGEFVWSIDEFTRVFQTSIDYSAVRVVNSNPPPAYRAASDLPCPRC